MDVVWCGELSTYGMNIALHIRVHSWESKSRVRKTSCRQKNHCANTDGNTSQQQICHKATLSQMASQEEWCFSSVWEFYMLMAKPQTLILNRSYISSSNTLCSQTIQSTSTTTISVQQDTQFDERHWSYKNLGAGSNSSQSGHAGNQRTSSKHLEHCYGFLHGLLLHQALALENETFASKTLTSLSLPPLCLGECCVSVWYTSILTHSKSASTLQHLTPWLETFFIQKPDFFATPSLQRGENRLQAREKGTSVFKIKYDQGKVSTIRVHLPCPLLVSWLWSEQVWDNGNCVIFGNKLPIVLVTVNTL